MIRISSKRFDFNLHPCSGSLQHKFHQFFQKRSQLLNKRCFPRMICFLIFVSILSAAACIFVTGLFPRPRAFVYFCPNPHIYFLQSFDRRLFSQCYTVALWNAAVSFYQWFAWCSALGSQYICASFVRIAKHHISFFTSNEVGQFEITTGMQNLLCTPFVLTLFFQVASETKTLRGIQQLIEHTLCSTAIWQG